MIWINSITQKNDGFKFLIKIVFENKTSSSVIVSFSPQNCQPVNIFKLSLLKQKLFVFQIGLRKEWGIKKNHFERQFKRLENKST